ncbi:MAG: response regulator [bacterium]
MKILIVDDAKFSRTMIREIALEKGYSIVGEAENGNEAVQLYKEFIPDVVTMDITMPDMNGHEAIKQIIEFDANANIIIVSATKQKTSIVKGIKAGAKNFVIKPFEPWHLIETINEVIK